MSTITSPATTGATIRIAPTYAQLPPAEIINQVWLLQKDVCIPSKGWIGTHLLTGWQGTWVSRAAAKRYFERPQAEQLAMIRKTSESMLLRSYTLREDKYRAHQVLAILNGAPILTSTPGIEVLPYDGTVEVGYRCYCGGYLAAGTGRRKHVNACEHCYTVDGPQGVCDNVDRHKACLRPAAAHCQHATCVAVADPSVKCEHGKEHSCGGHEC